MWCSESGFATLRNSLVCTYTNVLLITKRPFTGIFSWKGVNSITTTTIIVKGGTYLAPEWDLNKKQSLNRALLCHCHIPEKGCNISIVYGVKQSRLQHMHHMHHLINCMPYLSGQHALWSNHLTIHFPQQTGFEHVVTKGVIAQNKHFF